MDLIDILANGYFRFGLLVVVFFLLGIVKSRSTNTAEYYARSYFPIFLAVLIPVVIIALGIGWWLLSSTGGTGTTVLP